MEDVVNLIRALKEIEDQIAGLTRATQGRTQAMAAEAQTHVRQAQVYLDSIVKRDRRNDDRGRNVGGGP